MSDDAAAMPRWGNSGRDRKAAAIWGTLRLHGGERVDGAWLDIGCGSGGIAAGIAERVREVVGIDPEPWSTWTEVMSAHPNLRLFAAGFDGPQLPLPESSIDVAICNQVYEHAGDPQQLIRNIYRVLRPGGTCYFAGPNLLWPVEPHVFWPFVHWLPRSVAQQCMRRLGSRQADALDAYSTHCWNLRRWFRDSGFEVRCGLSLRIAAEFHLRGAPWLANMICRLPVWVCAGMEPLTPGFIFLLQKPFGRSDG